LDSERYVEVTIDGIIYKFREDVYYSDDGLWVALDGELARVGVGDHLCRSISPSLNFIELHPEFRQIVLHGSGEETIRFEHHQDGVKRVFERPFEGVMPNLRRRFRGTQSVALREMIAEHMSMRPCRKAMSSVKTLWEEPWRQAARL